MNLNPGTGRGLDMVTVNAAALIERAPKPARAVVLVAQAYAEWFVRGLRYFGRTGVLSAAYGRVLAWQLSGDGYQRRRK